VRLVLFKVVKGEQLHLACFCLHSQSHGNTPKQGSCLVTRRLTFSCTYHIYLNARGV
jgi:hypothetical protein